ncbi:MAG TPA: chitobiase/beta-hexosaminidase C-terminal domain-containing protein, partial [Fibrobacteria bacterium]|nr:chitobiase/beta-hexosaminidase C-terminal domain-containing protein [Fibrobacteria bacterium]
SVSFSTGWTRPDIPTMQVAVRFGESGSFQRQSLGYSTQVTTATKVEAYLLGWSAVAHRWLKGPLQTTIAGAPDLRGPGTDFGAPVINGPSQLGGTVSFTLPNLSGEYQNAKLAVWTSTGQTTTLQDAGYTFQASQPMTVKAYAIAWNSSLSRWSYGGEFTLMVPVQSESNPVATEPGDELPQPVATLPPSGNGNVGFSLPPTFPSDVGSTMLALKNSMGKWDVYDLSYQLPVSVGTSFTAYLIAWSTTEKRWKQGSTLTQMVTPSSPTNPPTLNAAGSFFSAPEINAGGAFPVSASVATPTDLPASFTPRKIAYRTAAIGATLSGEFTYLNDGSSISINSQVSLEACMVAWDATNAVWRVGRSKVVTVTGGLPVGEPDLALGGGMDLDPPQFNTPTGLPGNLSLFAPSLTSDQVSPKIAYQIGATGVWNSIRSGDKVWITSPTQVNAFVVAWSTSQQRWLYGRAKSFYVDPSGANLPPPTFTDTESGLLGGALEVTGMSFTINANTTTGSVYYTVDGTTPSPGSANTKLWSSGTILQIPTGEDSLVVRAVAWDGSRASMETRLVAHLPRWKVLDSRDLGCLVTRQDNKVFACGDHTGPKILTDSGWMDVVPNWSLPTAQTLHVNDSELVAGVEGEVWKIRKYATSPERIGDVDLGWVYSLVRFGGDLWASTDSLTVVYIHGAWRPQATPQEPLGTGPLWSDGSFLYQGSGDVVAKYAWDPLQSSNNWFDWGTKASEVRAFAADSFSMVQDGFVVATEDAVYQWNYSTSGTLGRSISDASVQGIEGIVWGPGNRLYVAFTNPNGLGGVRRSPGWASGWNRVALGWPGTTEGSPYGAKGVGIHRRGDGQSQVVATTPLGTYTVKLVGN